MRTRIEQLQLLTDVVEGRVSSVSLDYPISIAVISEYLKQVHNLNDLDNLQSNGWNWDYWTYYEGELGKFCLSGSGYYAKQNFSKYES